MNKRAYKLDKTALLMVACVCGLVASLLYVAGMFLIAGYLPPPSPDLPMELVVANYRDNQVSIITGLTMGFVGAGFMLPLWVMGSVFMAEVEEGFPYFSLMQALCALATVLFTALPNLVWMAAAFRPDRSPELVYLLHDLGWIMWATPSWGFAFQFVCFAICGLRDSRETPFVPRWLCYLGLWVAVGMLATPLVPFFMSGPFAWNGLFAFWIAFFSPVGWSAILVMLVIKRCMEFSESVQKGLAYE